MYKLHLILKYLRKRRIAWVSLVAVVLCTAMVLVVNSVMSGWINNFRQSFHSLTGDIIIRGDLNGFPDYDEIIRRVQKLPNVTAAVPVIQTFGLVNIPGVGRRGVTVIGYPGDIGRVNKFAESLHRKKGEKNVTYDLWPDVQYTPPPNYKGSDVRAWKGMIVGNGVIGLKADRTGNITNHPSAIYRLGADLTVLPVAFGSSKLKLDQAPRQFFWVIDDSHTHVHIVDSQSVYVAFNELQQLLEMDAQDNQPARTSEIQVAIKPDADLYAAKNAVEAIVEQVAREKGWFRYNLAVQTWAENYATFLGAVKRQRGLMIILFAIISMVAIFLIFCIFYMIVAEKTRDIGVIKSVGATSSGVAGIFLGYGLALGTVGGGLGLLAAWTFVHYINEIHELIAKIFHVTVYNPEVYLFDTIPNTMNVNEAAVIVGAAVIASVLGAVVPAIRAARMNPVEALRWE